MYRFRNQHMRLGEFLHSCHGVVGFIVIILGIVALLVGVITFGNDRNKFFLTNGQTYLVNILTKELEKQKTKIKPEIYKAIEKNVKEKKFGYAIRMIINTTSQDSNLKTNLLINPLFLIPPMDYEKINLVVSIIGKTQKNAQQVSWNKFWNKIFYPGLPIFWLVFSFFTFGAFAFEMSDGYEEERLLDLPWKKPWLWLFVGITFPINVPFFAGSGIRLLIEKNRENQDQKSVKSITISPNINAEPLHLDEEKHKKYKAFWSKTRAESYLEQWQKAVNQEGDNTNSIKENLRKLGNSIAEYQEKLADSQKKLQKLNTEKPEKTTRSEDILIFEEEFENLLKLPQITNVSVTESEINVQTKPIIVNVYQKHYDLGDYLITIDIFKKLLQITCTRRSKHKIHIYQSGKDFCFGTRNDLLFQTLKKSEFLPALCIALEGLYHINQADKEVIPRDYEEVV